MIENTNKYSMQIKTLNKSCKGPQALLQFIVPKIAIRWGGSRIRSLGALPPRASIPALMFRRLFSDFYPSKTKFQITIYVYYILMKAL